MVNLIFNKPKLIIFLFFLFLFLSGNAQDIVISINHDTIHCTIISINNDRIMYELKNNEGTTGQFISLSEVLKYSRSHQQVEMNELQKPKPSFNRMCLSMNTGLSTMPWFFENYKSLVPLPDYYSELKKGIHLKAGAHYMIKRFFGLGVEYSFFTSNVNGITLVEYYPSIFLKMTEKFSVYSNFLGASLLFKQNFGTQQKFIVSESLSAGVLFVRLEDQITSPNVTQYIYTDISTNTLITGNPFSGKLGVDAGYKIHKAVSIGLGADFLWCSLKRANLKSKETGNKSISKDNQKLSDDMNLSRIDYSIVVRYDF